MIAIALAGCSATPEVSDTGAPVTRDSLRALRWVAPGADKVQVLTTQPTPCLKAYDTTVTTADGRIVVSPIVIGGLAFDSPALLGGAAGRMGLSCASCHLSGRGNPDFMLEGVSGAPGTADITGNLLSKVRGDAVFNPVPIPDLAARDERQMKDRTGADFRVKLHGLIVEEFDGQEPPPAIFDAVMAYLDALDISRCTDPAHRRPVRATDDFVSADVAMTAAGDFARAGDSESALLMARAARELLQRLHERFAGAGQADLGERLVAASRSVEAWANDLRAGQARPTPPIRREIRAMSDLILAGQGASLYNPDVLRAALGE